MKKGIFQKTIIVIAIFFLLVTSMTLSIFSARVDGQDDLYLKEQMEASRIMFSALRTVRDERLARDIVIDYRLDPNGTGIIGEEFTELTTTLGHIKDKRSSANPDFAALMVKFFKQADLNKNDVVCIGASGSFPALTLATLCAAEALGLKPLVIYSVGASMYGANLPEFTFMDMLKAISDDNILPFSIIAVSLGGHGDSAEGMFFPDARERMLKIAEKSGLPFISEKDLQKSIKKRLAIYSEHAGNSPIKCFVNVGGASANFGDSEDSVAFPNGLVTKEPKLPPGPREGLIFHFIRSGVPVIHLLNVRGLSAANGIPYDPVPFPKPGASGVFRLDQSP